MAYTDIETGQKASIVRNSLNSLPSISISNGETASSVRSKINNINTMISQTNASVDDIMYGKKAVTTQGLITGNKNNPSLSYKKFTGVELNGVYDLSNGSSTDLGTFFISKKFNKAYAVITSTNSSSSGGAYVSFCNLQTMEIKSSYKISSSYRYRKACVFELNSGILIATCNIGVSPYRYDFYKSTNGIDFTKVTPNIVIPVTDANFGYANVNNIAFLEGYYSTDGINWTQASNPIPKIYYKGNYYYTVKNGSNCEIYKYSQLNSSSTLVNTKAFSNIQILNFGDYCLMNVTSTSCEKTTDFINFTNISHPFGNYSGWYWSGYNNTNNQLESGNVYINTNGFSPMSIQIVTPSGKIIRESYNSGASSSAMSGSSAYINGNTLYVLMAVYRSSMLYRYDLIQ